MHKMGPQNVAHMERILAEVGKDFREKYAAGQEEHGGEMWLKPGMLQHAIGEVLDLLAYLYTLREQEERVRNLGRTGPAGLRPLSQAVVKVGSEPR